MFLWNVIKSASYYQFYTTIPELYYFIKINDGRRWHEKEKLWKIKVQRKEESPILEMWYQWFVFLCPWKTEERKSSESHFWIHVKNSLEVGLKQQSGFSYIYSFCQKNERWYIFNMLSVVSRHIRGKNKKKKKNSRHGGGTLFVSINF